MFQRLSRCLLLVTIVTGCASTSPTIPQAWLSVPSTPRIGSVSYHSAGKLVTSPELQQPQLGDGPIRVVGTKIFNKEKELTAALPAIESLDFSESRGEVAFSAIGERGYDIGLVSSDGSPIHWIPQDPADELSPQWAPRGNKVSYIVRSRSGDIVRTVHIPTAAQLSVAFPNARIHARAWDAEGQFFAVAYSTPDASDRVEVMKYGGEERRMAVPPAIQLDVEVEPFARNAVLLRPRDIRYDEKLPVIVWKSDDFAWNDARAALLRNVRAACIVTTTPNDDLWNQIGTTSWMDVSRVAVVGIAPRDTKALYVVPDAAVATGHYMRRANVVSVAPAAIQSFAAGFIADQWKRTSPTNGSSR